MYRHPRKPRPLRRDDRGGVAVLKTQFEVFHSNHRWRAWLRIVDEHGNGEVLFSTPRGYATKAECLSAIELVMDSNEQTPIVFLSQGDSP
jgi:uncharacterized protein YegP (UPF0339 family)